MGIFCYVFLKKPCVLQNCPPEITGHTGKLVSVVQAMQFVTEH